jgi:hypothetical protein
MHRRFPSSVILVLLIGGCGFGQVNFPGQSPPGQYPPGQYPPGQYPPGQYPPGQGRNPQGGSSNPFPGRKKNTGKTQEDQVPVQTLSGMLRRISSTNAVIESEDKRIITVSIPQTTKYYKASEPGAASDFQPGDHVTVEATRDDNGYFHATKLTRVKPGTADERAAALEPVDASPLANRGNTAGSDDDADRPRLHRTPSEEPAPKPQTKVADSAPADAPQPAEPDHDDPGPPQLKHGSTPRSTEQTASNREPAGLRETQAKQSPAPSNSPAPANSPDVDPVIAKAREAAFTFSQTLPDYMVKQFTTRYKTDAAHRGQTSWQALDNVTADVVAERGKESYKNVLVNGKVPRQGVEQTGLWSTGDFAVTLQDVLSLASDADFHNKRAATIVNRAAFRYDYSVDQPNSHWHIYASAESYMPEYSGAIWIDKENYRVLRIEMSARNMPKAFPLDSVESAVDYDYVLIGNAKFLLPVRSEGLNCWRGTSECLRNVVEFRNYRKFGADTSVTFEATPDK